MREKCIIPIHQLISASQTVNDMLSLSKNMPEFVDRNESIRQVILSKLTDVRTNCSDEEINEVKKVIDRLTTYNHILKPKTKEEKQAEKEYNEAYDYDKETDNEKQPNMNPYF